MPKWVNTLVLDQALYEIAESNLMVAIAGQPASFAAAQAGKLAEASLASADFTLSAGAVSGRRVTIAGKSGLPVIAEGTADHVALLDTVGSRLLYVTTCPPQAIVTGGTVSIQQWSVEIGDPA